jgi:general stress protein 26
MTTRTPVAELDQRFSGEGASATDWADGRQQLEEAQIYWLATVRPDGRPHVVPLISVALDGALYFCTGETERKAKNLAANPHCIVLTGTNTWDEGLDVVVEGDARMVTDDVLLHRVADAYLAKYGEEWRLAVRDGAFYHGEGSLREDDYTGKALVFRITPTTAFGFGRGATFSQTRWRF